MGNSNAKITWKYYFLLIISLFFINGCTTKKPTILEGDIIETYFQNDDINDSYAKIITDVEGQLILLRFRTHSEFASFRDLTEGFYGYENFKGEALKLYDLIRSGGRIKIETLDEKGIERRVYKVLAITPPK